MLTQVKTNNMNEKVLEQYKLVEEDFKKRFPNSPYTMMLNIWDDGDFRIVAQYGDNQDILHIVEYDTNRDSIIYYTEIIKTSSIKIDKFGNKYYVPNELIKHLNTDTKENLTILNK